METETGLRAGGNVPHFTVAMMDGTSVAYSDIWQRRNLLLVLLSDDDASDSYSSLLVSRMSDLTAHDTACVISRGNVTGAPRPGVVIADKWGEVHFVAGEGSAGALPSPDEIVEWQGEAK